MSQKLSKTAKASMLAKVTGEKEVLSPEKAIAEIRSLRAGGLFVGNMEYVDLLLAEYDLLKEEISALRTYTELDDALRNMLQAFISTRDALEER